MKTTSRRWLALALSLCVLQTGCIELLGEMSNSVEYQERQALKAREVELLEKVEALSAKERENIADLKKRAAESIEAGDLRKGLSTLRRLHDRLHPCGGEPCGRSVASKEEYLLEYMIENGTDQEEAFVREQLARAATRAEEMNAEKRFSEVYAGAGAAKYGFDAYPEQRDALVSIRDATGVRWLEHLDARAKATRTDHPALSMFFVRKASMVASDIGDKDKAASYEARYFERLTKVREDNRLNILVGRATGKLGKSASNAMLSRQTKLMTLNTRDDGSINATIVIRSSPITYDVTATSGTGSFRYQEGTTSKPNPALAELERKRGISQGNFDDCTKACYDDGLFCFHNKYDGGQLRKVGESACRVRDAAQKEVMDLNAKIASTPKTIEEPAYKQKSFPLTRHTRKGTARLSYSLEFARGGKIIAEREDFEQALFDEEHDAHSYKGGGVSASGRSVPSEEDVFARIEKSAANWLSAELDNANAVFLEGLAATDPSDPAARADAIILLHVLSKDGAPEKLLSELDSLTGIPGASEVVR